jgi:hypothetical protein
MIIKDHAHIKTNYVGDVVEFIQGQDLSIWRDEMKELSQLHADTQGYSEDRTMRMIARIPDIEFLKHPEWMHDGNLILKWLKSDEGRNCVTNKIDTGRSGHIIIK